eukprot:scaffold143244_cov238-Phaeocystis_antarctica.AAC.2
MGVSQGQLPSMRVTHERAYGERGSRAATVPYSPSPSIGILADTTGKSTCLASPRPKCTAPRTSR